VIGWFVPVDTGKEEPVSLWVLAFRVLISLSF